MKSKRLQRLVRVQERVRTAKQADVASAQLDMRRSTEAVERAEAEQRAQESVLRQVQNWSHADLLLAAEMVVGAGTRVTHAQQDRAEVAKVLEQKQAVLRAADQDVKRLERLESKAREEELRLRRMQEQRAMDEIAARRRTSDEA